MKSLAAFLITAVLAMSASAADAPAAPAKPDLAKGSASYGTVCAACHGADGNSSVALQPSLAQQHPEYLVKQLLDFKSGARKDAIMQGFAATLTEQDARNISWWLASQKEKPGFAKEKDLVMLGEKIYRGGIAERQIPACSGCHTPDGGGIPAQFPRLAGQHAEYAEAQLLAFRDGLRKNGPMMTGVAARLSDKEIKALADYMAGLR